MFVISIKRAEDLADAMEARGYIPGAVRTKLVKMKCHLLDYVVLFVVLTLFYFTHSWKMWSLCAIK